MCKEINQIKSLETKFKHIFLEIAGLIKYIVVFVLIVGLFSMLFKGVRALSGVMIPVLGVISFAMFIAMFFIIVLPNFSKKYRAISPFAILIFSYFFGITAWILGLTATLYYFGFIWVVVGVFMLGVGVVPIGMLAFAVNGQWWNLAILLALLIFAYKARDLALQSGVSHGKKTFRPRSVKSRGIKSRSEDDHDKPRQAEYKVIKSTILDGDKSTATKKNSKPSRKKS